MVSDAPGVQMQSRGLTWPAAGVQVSVQVRRAPAGAPGAPVLSDSGDFPALPSPLFFALPSDSAKPDLGVGGQRGREHPTTFSGQPLTSGHPSSFHSVSPPRPPAMLQLGLTLLSCGGTSAMSSCGRAAADGGSGYTQAPHPGWGLCLPGGGAPFLVCTEVVAPLAVRRDFSPLSVPIGVKKPDWGGHQGSK